MKKDWEERFQRLSEGQNKLIVEVLDLKSQMDARFTQLSALVTKLYWRAAIKGSNIDPQLFQPQVSFPPTPPSDDVSTYDLKVPGVDLPSNSRRSPQVC